MFAIRFESGMYYAGGSATVEDDNGGVERVPLLEIKEHARTFHRPEVAQKIADTINEYTRKEYPRAEVVEV
jgi:hypothetical protein